MSYNTKAMKWKRDLLKGEDSSIEGVFGHNGKVTYVNKDGSCLPDFVYYCMLDHGKKVMERIWNTNDMEKETASEAFLMKGKKKMIVVQEQNTYGFGFGDNEGSRSVVLYIRKGSGAILIWSGTDGKQLNVMYEVNMENPESLDSLIDFMKCEDNGSSTHKSEESEDFIHGLMGN